MLEKEENMNFASAFISLQRGHKIRRKHWTGYWVVEDRKVFMYTYDGRKLNVRESEDMMYTMSNMACDDWEIADDYGVKNEL